MARQLENTREYIDRFSKFHNGRKCRLKKEDVEFAVNLVLEHVRKDSNKTTGVFRVFGGKYIELERLDRIINNLKL